MDRTESCDQSDHLEVLARACTGGSRIVLRGWER
jgi:hypothetical protein